MNRATTTLYVLFATAGVMALVWLLFSSLPFWWAVVLFPFAFLFAAAIAAPVMAGASAVLAGLWLGARHAWRQLQS